MDPLRFGPLDAPDTTACCPGSWPAWAATASCLGLPNIGGEAVFDESYAGNPLVNALCVGVLRHEDLHLAKASGVGNQVILYGARTGGDGIGGVSVLASETFDADGPAKRPSVQVEDPFMGRLQSSPRSRSSRPASSPASRTSAAPGSPAPPPSWPAPATAACTSSSTGCRCATPRSRRRRS